MAFASRSSQKKATFRASIRLDNYEKASKLFAYYVPPFLCLKHFVKGQLTKKNNVEPGAASSAFSVCFGSDSTTPG